MDKEATFRWLLDNTFNYRRFSVFFSLSIVAPFYSILLVSNNGFVLSQFIKVLRYRYV